MVGDSLAHNGAVLDVTGLTSGLQVVSGQILAGHGKVTGAVTVNSGGTQTAGDAVTDEASALEFVGKAPLLVEGSAQNFKVTYPQDFALAQAVLMSRGVANG